MQIGPIIYSKKEEVVFFKSIALGLLLGLPLGIWVNYASGFLEVFVQPSNDFAGTCIFTWLWVGSLESISFLITTVVYFSYSTKERLLRSWRDAARISWAIFTAFPVLITYVALVMTAFIFPLYAAVDWLSPIRKYWLGGLVFLPFLFLFMLIFLPDQKPRKVMAQAWLIVKGKAIPPKINLLKAVMILLIFFWLVFVFLPLPNVLEVNLLVIAGGLLIVAYLVKQRYQTKRK